MASEFILPTYRQYIDCTDTWVKATPEDGVKTVTSSSHEWRGKRARRCLRGSASPSLSHLNLLYQTPSIKITVTRRMVYTDDGETEAIFLWQDECIYRCEIS